MAWLMALSGELTGKRIVVRQPCLVGRGPYNHLVLDDTRISRQHAKISPELGGYFVYDLNSANGTYVNEQQVRRHRLQPEDIVRIGPFRFRFELGDEELQKFGVPIRDEMTFTGNTEERIIETLHPGSGAGTGPDLTSNLVQLEDAERKLHTLYTLMQAIATTLDQSELIDRVVRQLLDIYPTAELAAVYLRDNVDAPMDPWLIVRRKAGEVDGGPLPAQFVEDVVDKGLAILSAPLMAKPPGGAVRAGLSMHAPMIYGKTVYGVLHVQGMDTGELPYTQGDLDLLNGIALQTAMALQNVRMHQESLKQMRLQQDLILAEQIQKSFLPRQLPVVAGVRFVTDYRPAYTVGGDFYDIFWLTDGLLGIFIGDVAGKGISAALHMARMCSDFRVAAQSEREPAAVMQRVNQLLLDREQHEMFVTAVYVTFDVKTRKLKLASAGHLPPFVRRQIPGVLHRIDTAVGTALGIVADAGYTQMEMMLEAGDTLVLYTDGVIEATSPEGVQFDFKRLETSLAQGESDPRQVAERLFHDLDAHVREAAQYDDLTLVMCGVTNA